MSIAASKVEELLVIHQNADLIEKLTKEFNIQKKTGKEKACIDPRNIISVEAGVGTINNNEEFDDDKDFTMFNDSDEQKLRTKQRTRTGLRVKTLSLCVNKQSDIGIKDFV